MDNPLKNLIDKVTDNLEEAAKKPSKHPTKRAETTSTTSKKSTSGMTTAKAKKALDMMESKSAKKAELEIKKKEDELAKQKEAIAKKTHQDIINAAYKVADELKLKGGPWPLLRAAGWGNLTDDRGALYKGPAVDEIEALTAEQKKALKKVLDL